MNKNLEEGLEAIKYFISLTFNVLLVFAHLIIYCFLLMGAVASMILLLKLYPEMITTFLPFFKFLDFLFKILIIGCKILIIFLGTYLFAKLIIWFYNTLIKMDERKRERQRKRKKEFIKEIVKELKSKKK